MKAKTIAWSEFLYPIEVHEHITIPMRDGIGLSAKIWMPKNAPEKPVPAILEYIPYRKRDFTAWRDSTMHPYFAGHGYACLRVDLRGSGDSEGVLRDEYLQTELDDGVEVIEWMARQPWCSGQVGMIGISWGGFNGLQIAALQPQALKAIVSVCSTDDRYADDVHYMGGCLLSDNLSWASAMFAYNSCPPDPALVGEKWRSMWQERLEGSGLWLENWLRHPHRDDFWRHGSVCEDFAAVQTPVLAVSGWADGYSNAVFRLMEHLQAPFKGIIGAWGHQYPHLANIQQGMAFLHEALRWWDYWLKGQETGIMEEPALRAWMQDSVSPLEPEKRPGRWIGEYQWPSPNVHWQRFRVLRYGLMSWKDHQDVKEEELTIQSPLSVGMFAGKWCSYSEDTDSPSDQREEDGGALVFDSPVLKERMEIMGAPVVELRLSTNKPLCMVAVRLNDIAPDGKSTRVTYGLLNLTHRESHAFPSPMVPGERYTVRVQLNDVAQCFPAGHRFRLAVSTSYWPLAWPAPEAFKLSIFTPESTFWLPVRNLQARADQELPGLPPALMSQPVEKNMLQPTNRAWQVNYDLATNETQLRVVKDEGQYYLPHSDLTVEKYAEETYYHRQNLIDSVRGETKSIRSFQRKGWFVKTITRTVLTSDAENFYLSADLDAFEDNRRIFSRSWNLEIPRQYV